MKLRFLFFIILLFIPTNAFAEIHIVATLPTLASVAREIAMPNADIVQLASNREDPHFITPRPDYILKLSKADLLIYNGMELEIGWLPSLQKNARNPKIMDGETAALDASKYIHPLDVPTGKVDRSMGDIHAQGNPHYLYSLPNVMLVADAISARLCTIDSENCENYKMRLNQFNQKAKAIDTAWKNKLETLPDSEKRIVTYHDSMVYLNHWLGLNQISTIESKPGVAPSPSYVAKLTVQLKSTPVHAIIQENYQPTATSEKIAKIAKTKVIAIKPGPSHKQTYFEYVEEMLHQLFD